MVAATRAPPSTPSSEFLRDVSVLPLTRTIMKRFARIRGQLRVQGFTVEDPDLLIAATALTHRLTLVTRNVRHYRRIPNLVVYTRQ